MNNIVYIYNVRIPEHLGIGLQKSMEHMIKKRKFGHLVYFNIHLTDKIEKLNNDTKKIIKTLKKYSTLKINTYPSKIVIVENGKERASKGIYKWKPSGSVEFIDDYKTIAAHYSLSNACNLDCSYCYLSKKDRSIKIDDKFILSRVRLLTDKMKKEKILFSQIRLHGAEPLMCKPETIVETVEMLKYVSIAENKIKVQTNGTLLTEKYIKKMINKDKDITKKIIIGISIDAGKENHNKYRSESYDKATNALKLAIKYNFEVSTVAVIVSGEKKYLHNLLHHINMLENIGVKKISLKLVEDYENCLSIEDKKNIALFLLENNLNDNLISFSSNICVNIGNNCEFYEFDSNGKVFSCNKAVSSVGSFNNWINNDLRTIIEQRKLVYKEYQVSHECLNCELNFLCNSGCPLTRVDGKAIDCELKLLNKEWLLEKNKKYINNSTVCGCCGCDSCDCDSCDHSRSLCDFGPDIDFSSVNSAAKLGSKNTIDKNKSDLDTILNNDKRTSFTFDNITTTFNTDGSQTITGRTYDGTTLDISISRDGQMTGGWGNSETGESYVSYYDGKDMQHEILIEDTWYGAKTTETLSKDNKSLIEEASYNIGDYATFSIDSHFHTAGEHAGEKAGFFTELAMDIGDVLSPDKELGYNIAEKGAAIFESIMDVGSNILTVLTFSGAIELISNFSKVKAAYKAGYISTSTFLEYIGTTALMTYSSYVKISNLISGSSDYGVSDSAIETVNMQDFFSSSESYIKYNMYVSGKYSDYESQMQFLNSALKHSRTREKEYKKIFSVDVFVDPFEFMAGGEIYDVALPGSPYGEGLTIRDIDVWDKKNLDFVSNESKVFEFGGSELQFIGIEGPTKSGENPISYRGKKFFAFRNYIEHKKEEADDIYNDYSNYYDSVKNKNFESRSDLDSAKNKLDNYVSSYKAIIDSINSLYEKEKKVFRATYIRNKRVESNRNT